MSRVQPRAAAIEEEDFVTPSRELVARSLIPPTVTPHAVQEHQARLRRIPAWEAPVIERVAIRGAEGGEFSQ
jgi:hypothetical protein